jgi:hypothetical protein
MVGELFRIQAQWDSRQLKDLQSAVSPKNLRFAQSLAVNATARRVKANEEKVMAQRFDRPTPFTMRSLFFKPGAKDKPEATVWFKDFAPKGTPAGEYLLPQVHSGARKPKRLERNLRQHGFLRAGEFVVPASGAPLDRYGNVQRGLITKVMSGLGAFSEVGFNANATKSRRSQQKRNAARYFFGSIHGQGGIWERLGAEWVTPLFIVEQGAPRYRTRFPFFAVAENTVAAHYESAMSVALSIALRPIRGGGSFSPVSFHQ